MHTQMQTLHHNFMAGHRGRVTAPVSAKKSCCGQGTAGGPTHALSLPPIALQAQDKCDVNTCDAAPWKLKRAFAVMQNDADNDAPSYTSPFAKVQVPLPERLPLAYSP